MATVSNSEFKKALGQLLELQKAFQIVFGQGPANSIVQADLAKFCRANETCWSEDERHHARLEGRREVWLHIRELLDKSAEELLVKLNGPITVVAPEQEDENDG